MPRSLASGLSATQELRHFTNREDERNVLRRLLTLPPGQPLPVVMFYGVGGTGKSWLLRRLRADLPQEIPSALLDFDPQCGGAPYHTDYSRALAELRRQLASVECPRFDLAYSWLRFHEGVKEEPLLKDKGLAGIATEALAELAVATASGLPLVGFFTRKIAAKLGKQFKGSKLERWLAEKTNQEDFLRLRVLSAQDIYPLLVDRFLRDLAENLPAQPGRVCRGVLFLDTAEAVRIGLLGDAQIHQREQWLRDLHRSNSPVLLVLAGRDRLSWEDADLEYRDSRFLEQHLVGGLSERDSRLFLQHCGITDPNMQQAVLRVSVDTETAATGGDIAYHPFSLGLCADTLHNEPGAVPASFDMAPGDVTRLADRFLKSLAGPAYEIWVRRLALTPRFDETAARAAFSANRDVNQDAAWQYLCGFSFVREADEPGWWTLHYRMREALTAAYPDQAVADHQFWQDHSQRRSRSEIDDFAALAWYHQYALQPEEALDAWNALVEKCYKDGRMADHYRLLGWWEPTGLEDKPPASPEAARQLRCLGIELRRATLGSRSENVHRAIACYEGALLIYTETDFQSKWAMTQTSLGLAYAALPAGDRAANLRKAIACYAAALRVHTKRGFPYHWAVIQHNLGNAYKNLPTGARAADLSKAITCYEDALRVHTERDFPANWARNQNELGLAYAALPAGDRAANLRKAIACYTAALRVLTERDYPADWARLQNSLGIAYDNLPVGDRAANLRKAIACYQGALRVRTETDFPDDWAATQNNLGTLYADLPAGDRAANLEQAIACYVAALRVCTETDFPAEWATIQNNLGVAYDMLPRGDRAVNLEKAIACYNAALRSRTETDFPAAWAATQNNLGIAWAALPTGDRTVNLRKAVTCYAAALRVRKEINFPTDWAKTQNNLGNAYADMPAGDRAANLAKAIVCYEDALRVYTETDFPASWAMTQFNLGAAYKKLPTGDRASNMRKAIACYTAALRAYTESDFPTKWAAAQNNLGVAWAALATGDRASNLRKAIACYEEALRVRTEAEFPAEWANTQDNLGQDLEELAALTKEKLLLLRAIACFEPAVRGYAVCGLTDDAEEMRKRADAARKKL